MSRQDKIREVIKQLKIVREDRGLSLQRILDMVLESGGNISMGTVRRVFEDGSEERNFRYEDSIKPIADVLLNVQSTPSTSGADVAELDALRALVRYKNSYIAELEAVATNIDARVAAVKEEEQKKIDFLKEQIAVKDGQLSENRKLLDERRDFIYRKDRAITILSVLLGLCLAVIIGALLIDRANPDMGFFWLDGVSSFVSDNLFGINTSFTTGVQV